MPIVPEQGPKLGPANACGFLQDRTEDRLQIGTRRADDTKALSSRALPFQGLAQFAPHSVKAILHSRARQAIIGANVSAGSPLRHAALAVPRFGRLEPHLGPN